MGTKTPTDILLVDVLPREEPGSVPIPVGKGQDNTQGHGKRSLPGVEENSGERTGGREERGVWDEPTPTRRSCHHFSDVKPGSGGRRTTEVGPAPGPGEAPTRG